MSEIRFALGQAPHALGGSFRETVGPLYQEAADLLLRRAAARERVGAAGADEAVQQDLRAAREVMEKFKAAELEDYFRDECVAILQARKAGLDRMPAQTAALYPILLPDRTELILTIGDRLQRVAVPAGEAVLTAQVHDFRRLLERVTLRQYLRPARRLYDLLIRPVEPVLAAQRIDTLVFVPDGALRTVPMAALHDGQRFLIERYRTVVVPGLTLLDTRPIPPQKISVLLAALTVKKEGYAPLPGITREVQQIARLFDTEVLQDRRFVKENIRTVLTNRPFSIVHIASHGRFSQDAEASFLLTFGNPLSMDELEELLKATRFRNVPVELLVLSACQTASGSDRAALGLAGVAIKAGARSALASLWFVNDEAAAELMRAFYAELQTPGISKAQALQNAQLSLLRQPRFRHPGYWSAFVLVGNWQ